MVSAYVHTGEVDTPKQVEKYQFLEAMDARLGTLTRSARKSGTHVLVCGDLNIAHHEVDIKNWRGNRGKAGFLEDERAYLDRWFARDWVDLGRTRGGPGAARASTPMVAGVSTMRSRLPNSPGAAPTRPWGRPPPTPSDGAITRP